MEDLGRFLPAQQYSTSLQQYSFGHLHVAMQPIVTGGEVRAIGGPRLTLDSPVNTEGVNQSGRSHAKLFKGTI